MEITYYYEFFCESLIKLISNSNIAVLTLPSELQDKALCFKSFDSGQNVCMSVKNLLEELKIKYNFSGSRDGFDQGLISNFHQDYIADFSEESVESNNKYCNLPKKEIYFQCRNDVSEENPKNIFSAGTIKKFGEMEYLITKELPGRPYIVIFNAYIVDFNIWSKIFSSLRTDFNLLLFNGDYGPLTRSSFIISEILHKEKIESAAALSWCSGFKVFADFYNNFPCFFKRIISITGNYNRINGKSMLTGFEQSLLSISKLVDNDEHFPLADIFPFFFKKQKSGLFGIPSEINPIISNQFLSDTFLKKYLYSVTQLSQYDLGGILRKLDIPLINIIASNDTISLFDSNCALNSIVSNCNNIVLNFSTHWCLWTHANQISDIVKNQMEELT